MGLHAALLEQPRWHRSCQTLTDPEPCRLCLTSVLRRECSSRPPPSLRRQVFGGRQETTFKRLQGPPWPYWERSGGEEPRLQRGFPLLASAQLPWKLVGSAQLTAEAAPLGQDVEVAVVSFVWKIQMFLSEWVSNYTRSYWAGLLRAFGRNLFTADPVWSGLCSPPQW